MIIYFLEGNDIDMNDNNIDEFTYEDDPFVDHKKNYTQTSYKKSFTNSILDKDPESLKKLVSKIRAIFLIIWGPICMLIIAAFFIFPKYIEDKVPTTYIKNGLPVTKEEFYSSPIPFIFMLFCFVPTIIGIVELVKVNKE